MKVPLADATLVAVPAGVRDEEALLLGDILSTGYFCAEQAGIEAEVAAAAAEAAVGGGGGGGGGGSEAPEPVVVAVVGCGPVGLLAIVSALELGGGGVRVLAVDSVAERLAAAERLGARGVDREREDAVEVVRCAGGGAGQGSLG